MSTIVTDAELVWSNATTSMYHPLTEAVPAGSVGEVRATLEMSRRTGNIECQVYYEYSYDGITWTRPGSPLLGPAVNTNTTDYGEDFQTLSTTVAGAQVRFGVEAANTSGTSLSVAYVSIRIETRT